MLVIGNENLEIGVIILTYFGMKEREAKLRLNQNCEEVFAL